MALPCTSAHCAARQWLLPGEHLQYLDVRGQQKIWIGAFEAQHTNTAGVVSQRDSVEPPHSGSREIALELGSGLFARGGIYFVAVLANVHHFFGEHGPTKEVVERGNVRCAGIDLSETSDGAKFVLSTVLEGDGSALIGNHRLRRIDEWSAERVPGSG